MEQAEIKQNKAIRGYIIRCLVKGFNNTALTRQISNSMMAAGLIISPDISKYLDYLQGADTSSLQLKRSQPTQLMQMMQLSSLPKQELTLPKEQLKMQELIFNGKKEDTDKSIFKDR